MAATIPAVIVPMFWFIKLADSDSSAGSLETIEALSALGGIQALAQAASQFHWELFLCGLAASFLIGQIMFRQDFEVPDKFSWIMTNMHRTRYSKFLRTFRWILRTVGKDLEFTITKEDAKNFDGMVRPPLNQECTMTEVRVEFPYSHLKEYLNDRGFHELAKFVKWKADPKNPFARIKTRTKQFINDKKARLEFYYPNQLRELTRIEGHIRLHSSLWYASFYLGYISILGLFFGLSTNGILLYRFNKFKVEIILFPICVYLISCFLQHLIEKAFHYQRAREVFYVLTLVSLARDLNPKIFSPRQNRGLACSRMT